MTDAYVQSGQILLFWMLAAVNWTFLVLLAFIALMGVLLALFPAFIPAVLWQTGGIAVANHCRRNVSVLRGTMILAILTIIDVAVAWYLG